MPRSGAEREHPGRISSVRSSRHTDSNSNLSSILTTGGLAIRYRFSTVSASSSRAVLARIPMEKRASMKNVSRMLDSGQRYGYVRNPHIPEPTILFGMLSRDPVTCRSSVRPPLAIVASRPFIIIPVVILCISWFVGQNFVDPLQELSMTLVFKLECSYL